VPDIFDTAKKEMDIFDQIEVPEKTYQPSEFPQLQPRPTQEVAAKLLPFALDVAGGFAASKIPIPFTALPKVAKAAGLGMRMAGAGTGGALGSMAGQTLEGKRLDWKEIGLQGGAGAASELMFPLLKLGGKGAKILENLTVSGKTIKSFLRDRVEKQAVQRASNFIMDAAPDVLKKLDKTDDIGKAITEAMDENRLLYNQFGEGIKAAEDANGEIYLSDTVNYLNEILQKYLAKGQTVKQAEVSVLKEFKYPASSSVRSVLQKIMQGDPVPAKDFEWLFKHYNPQTWAKYEKGLLQSVKDKRVELKDVMLDDIDRLHGGTGEVKRQADLVHGAIKEYESLLKTYKRNMIETKEGIRFYPNRLADDLQRQKSRIMAKNPELWDKISFEILHYRNIAKRLKETRVEKIPGGGISAGTLGYILLGPKGSISIETLGALSALGTMSDTASKILLGGSRTALKGAAHYGSYNIDFK